MLSLTDRLTTGARVGAYLRTIHGGHAIPMVPFDTGEQHGPWPVHCRADGVPMHIETVRVPPLNSDAVAYALVSDDDSCAAVLTMARAIELQREGVPFRSRRAGEPLRGPDNFDTFFS
jgi:hypothetical protein